MASRSALAENMSTAGFAMLATMPLAELGTELFPVLEGRPGISICHIYRVYICTRVCTAVCTYIQTRAYGHIYHSSQAFTLVQPTSATPWISPSYTATLWGPLEGCAGCRTAEEEGRERERETARQREG